MAGKDAVCRLTGRNATEVLVAKAFVVQLPQPIAKARFAPVPNLAGNFVAVFDYTINFLPRLHSAVVFRDAIPSSAADGSGHTGRQGRGECCCGHHCPEGPCSQERRRRLGLGRLQQGMVFLSALREATESVASPKETVKENPLSCLRAVLPGSHRRFVCKLHR